MKEDEGEGGGGSEQLHRCSVEPYEADGYFGAGNVRQVYILINAAFPAFMAGTLRYFCVGTIWTRAYPLCVCVCMALHPM